MPGRVKRSKRNRSSRKSNRRVSRGRKRDVKRRTKRSVRRGREQNVKRSTKRRVRGRTKRNVRRRTLRGGNSTSTTSTLPDYTETSDDDDSSTRPAPLEVVAYPRNYWPAAALAADYKGDTPECRKWCEEKHSDLLDAYVASAEDREQRDNDLSELSQQLEKCNAEKQRAVIRQTQKGSKLSRRPWIPG